MLSKIQKLEHLHGLTSDFLYSENINQKNIKNIMKSIDLFIYVWYIITMLNINKSQRKGE